MAFLNWSFLFGIITGTTGYITLKWIHNKLIEKTNINEDNDDCILFWPNKGTFKCIGKDQNPCKHFSCPNCNYNKFIAHLKSTKKSIDICVYLITSEEITNIILYLFRRGVFVRIIIDKQMSDEAHGSKWFVFIKEHIPIKVIQYCDYLMHNKFVIIDQKKVITGSFNWTRSAADFNYENAVIVHNPKILKKYNAYFHNIWHSYNSLTEKSTISPV